jgi:UDP-2,3-diacylglucosamine pyrophosphatase LpxH
VVKAKVKSAVSFISDYEEQLCAVAEVNHCSGVICGHIHQAADKTINNIHYLNSGDWVETMSALVETTEGEWKIIYYNEWLAQLQPRAEIITTETPSFFPNLTPELV